MGEICKATHAAGYESELLITHLFEVPRKLVMDAWTMPEQLAQWWAPKGCTVHVDVKPGGVFHYQRKSPDGRSVWGKFTFYEVTASERLVFTNSFADEAGNTIRAPFNETWPLEIINTLTFSEHEGSTILILQGVPFHATDAEHHAFRVAHDGMRQGFTGILHRLAGYLETQKERYGAI